MKILVTGGSGYKGSVLIPSLLRDGHEIVNIDTGWFGNHLKTHKNLLTIQDDIRNLSINNLEEIDSIIHLANIANDPAIDLNPNLSWEVNVLLAINLLIRAVRAGVRQLLYASSGSVYGGKEKKK